VQAYIAAMPGWKRAVGRRLDALIVRVVPHVRKAVKWNSPFYGVEGEGWFLSFQVFARYVKVTFFRGTSLRPVPPGASKHKEVRYMDIHEDDGLDVLALRGALGAAQDVQTSIKVPKWDKIRQTEPEPESARSRFALSVERRGVSAIEGQHERCARRADHCTYLQSRREERVPTRRRDGAVFLVSNVLPEVGKGQ